MYKYILFNNVSKEGLKLFNSDFTLTEDHSNAHLAIVRSTKMHDLQTEHLLAIARAGSGTNNIPVSRCADEGVVVFNTPGANANAVKELALLGILMSSRDVLAGSAWVNTLRGEKDDVPSKVEKGKSQFNGSEILGKQVAVIGMGAIGTALANSVNSLGMKVCGYSPSISRGIRPKGLDSEVLGMKSIVEAIDDADYVVLCLPLNDKTRGMYDKSLFDKMKDGSALLNFSRAGLINEDDLEDALSSKVRGYVTDFTTDRVLGMQNTICFPHMGASTKEATDNCAVMAVCQAQDYILNGNIKNSVNYPDISMGEKSGQRLCVLYHADEEYSNIIEQYLTDRNIDIKGLSSVSRNGWGAMLVDLCDFNESYINEIESMDLVTKARLI